MAKDNYIPIEALSKMISSNVYKSGRVHGAMSSSSSTDKMGGHDLDIYYTFFDKTAKIHMNYGAKDHLDFEQDLENAVEKGRKLLLGRLEGGLETVFSETIPGNANIVVSGKEKDYSNHTSTRTPSGKNSGLEAMRALREEWDKEN